MLGFHHIALAVSDFDKSVDFYTNVLGLKKKAQWGEGDSRAVMLQMDDGGIIEVFANGTKDEPKNERFFHLAFATEDVDGYFQKAIAGGATCHIEPKNVDIPSDPVMPVRIAFVKGFDGEVLEFFKFL